MLINYLAEQDTGRLLRTASCSSIKAPLFVAGGGQVGLSWNEVSRRYVDHMPEFYTPTGWRGRAKTNKQGSQRGYIHSDQGTASLILEDVHNKCLDECEMPSARRRP